MPLKSTLHSPASTGIVVAHECRHRIRSLEASLALGEPSENAVRKWLDNDGNGWKCYEMVNICQNGLKWSENLLRREKQIWVHNVKLRKGCCFLLPAMTVPSTSSSKIHHHRWWTVHSIKGFKMFQVFPLIRNNSNSHAFLIVSQSLSLLIVVTIVVWHGQTAPETWNSKKIQETSNEPNTATQNRRRRCRQGSKILCLRCGWSVIDVYKECSRNVQIVKFISIHMRSMRSFNGRSKSPNMRNMSHMSQSTHPVSLRKSPKRTVTDSSSGGFACMAHRGFDDQVSCKVAQRPPQKDPGEIWN